MEITFCRALIYTYVLVYLSKKWYCNSLTCRFTLKQAGELAPHMQWKKTYISNILLFYKTKQNVYRFTNLKSRI